MEVISTHTIMKAFLHTVKVGENLVSYHVSFHMFDSDDSNLFQIWNFTMKLLHLLGFTAELVFWLANGCY